jgi:4-diphosphocytidyl-2-C-methyl-D-erythritol kinase
VISFPNCKINLGLNIVGKRSDGYHDLETVFVPVPFEDCLEIGRATGESTISIAGLSIDGNVESNLCWKAYQLLKNRFDLPAIDIKLYKQIPTGAGLGGGSSNAAFTLRLLNEKFNLQIQQHELIDFASQLGSDCAFFIINQPCIGSGRGEVLTPISVPQLDEMFGVLVMPGIHISSGWAFQQITPTKPSRTIKEIINLQIQDWKNYLGNDFEEPVFKSHPQLKRIKDELYQQGAIFASMSGSGSAMYGIFSELPSFEFPESYAIKSFSFNRRER